MKSGWAMLALALRALGEVCPPPAGDLVVVGVIEEECGGNGTLASVRAGIGADAVLLPEPTDLELLVRGNGVLWVDISVDGSLGHAEAAHTGASALDAAWTVIGALRELAAELEQGAPAGTRYNANVGFLEAGDWPSSVPGSARMRVRIGFPAALTPDDALERVNAAVAAANRRDPWLAAHPPRVTASGFRAEAYELDPGSPLVRAVAEAHERAHGDRPALVGTNGTTDARYYLNQAATPALCYGPRTRGMHGIDEAVELASIVAGALTAARFAERWLNGGE
jgi:acetylornithine deacetylase